MSGDDLTGLLQAGIRLQADGRLGEAERCYQEALQRYPGHPRALHLLGLLSQRQGDVGAAEELFRKAIAAAGDQPIPLISLGVLLAGTGREREAATTLQRAVQVAPGNYQALSHLAMVLHRLGDLGNALSLYEKACAVNPDSPGLLVFKGSALNSLGRREEAIRTYRKAIEIDPRQPTAFGNLGNALAAAGRYDEAIAAFDASIALQPGNATSYANLGSCHLRAGDFGNARAAFEQCLARAPGDITALAMQAAICNELGDKETCGELLDYETLLSCESVDPPEPYRSTGELNRELEQAVLAHPSLEYEPGQQTTRLGQQTGTLIGSGNPAIDALEAIIRGSIARYVDRRESSGVAGPRGKAPRLWRLDIWATVLSRGGHQMPHIHTSGWLSGVYYVKCPIRADDPDRHGWIEFGEPPPEYPFREPAPTKLLEPEEGLLVLFPSYFYHRTIPFDGDIPRISIAFDMVPSRHGATA